MSIWAQIGDTRVTQVPPDGRTPVDVYIDFAFSGDPLPEGVLIKFIAGKGDLDFGSKSDDEVKKWTEGEIIAAIVPIDGVTLIENESNTTRTLVRGPGGKLETRVVAKTTIKPIGDILQDDISVVAYTSYDKAGTVTTRLQPDIVKLPVSSGGGVFLSVMERYDPAANKWTKVSSMPTGRSGLSFQEVSGKLYAIGGFAGGFLDNNEKYDPVSDSWSALSPIPTGLAFASSVVYSGEIYVLGGMNFDPGSCLSSVYKYTPLSDSWTALAEMPLPVAFGTAQVVGSEIIVMMGANSIKGTGKGEMESIDRFNLAVMRYDIVGDSWSIDGVQLTSPTTTVLSTAVLAGGKALQIPTATSLAPYGVIIINSGGGTEEVHTYLSYDSKSGVVYLDAGLSSGHSAGESITTASLPEIRMAPCSVSSGIAISIFDGQQFFSYTGSGSGTIRGALCTYDTSALSYVCSTVPPSPSLPRVKAGIADVAGKTYIVGGSSKKSQWSDEVEVLYAGVFSGPSGFEQMTFPRNSLGVASDGTYIYAAGGSGDGHEPGWLQITVTTTPEEVRADGRMTCSASIKATDASGDPPPNGTKFSIRGLIYVPITDKDKQDFQTEQATLAGTAIQSSTGGTGAVLPPARISILPVLFSARDITMTDGVASTILLPRSEDPIKEVENLSTFVKKNEAIVDQNILKENLGTPTKESSRIITAGDRRELYDTSIEVSVRDPFYFGTTDTDSLIAQTIQTKAVSQETAGQTVPTSDFSTPPLGSDTNFSFNPAPAKQGLSANVKYFSDIASIPDIEIVTDDPVSASDAKDEIDSIAQEVPFGASPMFDAIVSAAGLRIVDPPSLPLLPPTNEMVVASDNDESSSSNSSQDAADEANAVAGPRKFPVFITNFVVTDPISLAARRSRTDVADLERISSQTGGNSFSVVDESYIDFVIERIKTSAPSSIGSGTIVGSHDIDGALSSVSYTIDNMIAGNSAEMLISYSDDGYNFTDLGVVISPNATFTIGTPIFTKTVRYQITLRSKTFNSPLLKAISLNYVTPNVQYLFTFPQSVSGQVSELASVVNHRLPDGSYVEMGFVHGESFMFERDYENTNQPSVRERATIMAINRSFDTILADGQSTKDVLRTDDFLIYKSISGPWTQDATTIVFINDVEADPADYILAPERGMIAFSKRLGPSDVVYIEIDQPSTFRFGMRIVNPSPDSTGLLDSFAYAWATSQDDTGYALNRSPRAVNLFISPIPAQNGGPLIANYTFTDPDGDEEDTTQSVITWFRDGVPIPELTGKKQITNQDLVARRADGLNAVGISKGQEWFFTIKPSDGKSFGPLATSHKVVIANSPPAITSISLKSSNKDPLTFTSSDAITAVFSFIDSDGDVSKNSVFTWFVNGAEVQSGTDNTFAPAQTGENGAIEAQNFKAGDAIRCDVIPSDGTDFGTSVSSNTVTIGGTPPSVSNVAIAPSNPSTLSNLRLTYTFKDVDQRADGSTIKWFKNKQTISSLDNTRQVPSSMLSPSQEWYAEITPSNGIATGDIVRSNAVTIEF